MFGYWTFRDTTGVSTVLSIGAHHIVQGTSPLLVSLQDPILVAFVLAFLRGTIHGSLYMLQRLLGTWLEDRFVPFVPSLCRARCNKRIGCLLVC